MEERPIVIGVFGKAQAWIQDNIFLDDAGAHGTVDKLKQVLTDIGDNAVRVSFGASRSGAEAIGLPVHQTDGHIGIGADCVHVGVCETAGDIVDEHRALGDCCLCDTCAHSIDADQVPVCRELTDHRHDSGNFLILGNAVCAGASGLATDVENMCAFSEQLVRMGNRRVEGLVQAAIGKAVLGDVDNAHHLAELILDTHLRLLSCLRLQGGFSHLVVQPFQSTI